MIDINPVIHFIQDMKDLWVKLKVLLSNMTWKHILTLAVLLMYIRLIQYVYDVKIGKK